MKVLNIGKALMKTMTIALSVVLVSLMSVTTVQAGTLAGVTMADQATVGDKSLVLNGMGVRTATMMKVKVYVIGLYLKSKTSNANEIITSNRTKRIEMHFVRDVSAKDLKKGWSEGFKNNAGDLVSIQSEIAKFNSSMRDMKEGDRLVIDFDKSHVVVSINDEIIKTIGGATFQRAVMRIWLGPKPPNKELKAGILGN